MEPSAPSVTERSDEAAWSRSLWLSGGMLILYGLLVAGAAYLLFSNSGYLERMHERALARAVSEEDREEMEAAHDNLMRVVRNPAWRLLATGWVTMVAFRSMVLLVILLWAGHRLVGEHPVPFRDHWVIAGTGMLLPGAGSMVHMIGNLWTDSEQFRLGPGWLMPDDIPRVVATLLRETDLFTVAFLAWCSYRSVARSHESAGLLFFFFLCLWIIFLLIGYLTGVSVFITS